jgi:predicted TIM-barrel fold metal-dependent hydrolase
MHHRLTHDYIAALVCQGMFDRHPGLRVATIESGATWVPDLMRTFRRIYSQHRDMFQTHPVEQFHKHVWVAPFVEDDVAELARYIPVERILFGSDWPHAEGLAEPRDFLQNVASFSVEDQRKIMGGNARELVFG